MTAKEMFEELGLQELNFSSEEMMCDDEKEELDTYVSFKRLRYLSGDGQEPRNEIEISFFPDEGIDFDKFMLAVKKKAEEKRWLDE